ncbi:hypothetical protein FHR90_001879 [Endobacter medicaginis]|uniref:Lipoprotein n=2 Tax=Endobacter medicaginis TaxID=1181271 RepID=A0A839V070_9PROT|nr:hypothetical protein [Endobacter medicaginis]MBB3174043.1 hypothetical protein [Endobacter medicaginis]MCX5477026.1 hypothetical protein [Endobacter medicaginis]
MRLLPLAAAIMIPALACLPLAGCGGGPASEAAQDFRPLDFSYLTVLHLNVGSVTVQDNETASDGGLAAKAPEPPAEALTAMANQRLVASGGNATAVFSIDRASITADGDTLDGHLAVHLDIIGANGTKLGLAQAQVSRQFTGTGDSKAALYAMVKQMMADMNVEFEYQVRRSLKDWLLTASGAPVNATVSTTTLAPPGTVAPVQPAAPVAGGTVATPTPLAPPAVATSPQPSYLVPPKGAVAVPAKRTGVIPPSTFDVPSNLPTQGPATANPAPNTQPWGY